MQTLHCLWQRKQVASISKNSGMEENWKKNLATDSYGNPVRSISNLRLIFTLDENLSQIRYDTFCQDDVCFCPLFRNVNGNKIDEESAGKIQDYLERTYRIRLTQNKVFEMLKTTSSERSFNPVQEFITRSMGRAISYRHNHYRLSRSRGQPTCQGTNKTLVCGGCNQSIQSWLQV